MSKINSDVIRRILEETKIVDVVGDFIDLKKRGVRYFALCPFHDDRTIGSFVVYPKGNCYKCFSCGKKGGAVDFLMEYAKLSYPDAIRYLGKKYNIDTDMKDFNFTPPPPRPTPPPLPTLYLPWNLVEQRSDTSHDALCNWIRTGINWDTIQRNRIESAIQEYHIGHSVHGHTIFWQIDENMHIRTGKMMKYKGDGHRDRGSYWDFDYIHSLLIRREHDDDPYPFPSLYDPTKQEHRLTFFGMHLLNSYSAATVNIVESEKTALLMAVAYGNSPMQIWMACGGLEMISRERLAPIIMSRRKIVLFPDRDGIEKWQRKALDIGYDRMIVNTAPVTKWWKERDGEKADIADVIINQLNENGYQPKTIGDVAKDMPQVRRLIDELKLQIPHNE